MVPRHLGWFQLVEAPRSHGHLGLFSYQRAVPKMPIFGTVGFGANCNH